MARKAKKTENAETANAINPSDEISRMEETIKILEAKLDRLTKKKKDNENSEDSTDSDSSSSISKNSRLDSSLSSFRVSDDIKDSSCADNGNNDSRIIDKDENPLSNKTFEIDPEQKENYMIQIYLLYPITSGEIMVQIDAYLNIYQVAENRKLIQKCEAEIMKTNEPQPLQISVTTKEEPNREKTLTFSKVIGIIHSLPMITSITTV